MVPLLMSLCETDEACEASLASLIWMWCTKSVAPVQTTMKRATKLVRHAPNYVARIAGDGVRAGASPACTFIRA
ncbi:MAG TPA: hypothetical protein DHV65_12325, partial [Ktedonobacter sp.]|nr:hypothetical protein [Ktedonobacter sp.]